MSAEISPRSPLSVTQLVGRMKRLLESNFPVLLVAGEISNYTVSGAGHAYFTLRDSRSQLSAVMFKSSRQMLRFTPVDGDEVVIRGKLTVYGPRGNCQLQILGMKAKGKGDKGLAFERLKTKLGAEGLFDPDRKQEIPAFPALVGVVTSATGAAIRDILQVLGRRFSGLSVLLNPVRVQGQKAGEEVASAIEELSLIRGVDVIIVGRGGGAAEDLQAFNDEKVARAIAASSVPIISAVGHEIDWTISDLVADCRAPTPSAAAELVVGNKTDLIDNLVRILRQLNLSHARFLAARRSKVIKALESWALREPERLTQEYLNQVKKAKFELDRQVSSKVTLSRGNFNRLLRSRIWRYPCPELEQGREIVLTRLKSMDRSSVRRLSSVRLSLKSLWARLENVSPLSVLGRGYAMVLRLPGEKIVSSTSELTVGDKIKAYLGSGSLIAQVEKLMPDDDIPG